MGAVEHRRKYLMKKPRALPPRIIPAVTWEQMVAYASATGFTVGAASSTDNALARFDGVTGKILQNSLVTVSDTGQLSIAAGSVDDAFIVTSTFNGYQAKVRYDATHYLGIGVTATGNTTIRAFGDSASSPLGFFSGTNSAINFTGAAINFFGLAGKIVFMTTNATTAEFRYDVSNYLALSVSSSGAVTFDAVGASAGFAFSDIVNTTESYQVDGTKVVGNQGAAVTDPTGGTVQDSEARTAIIAIIDRLQEHGLIA